MTATVVKTPTEIKSVDIDWSDSLDTGEVITTSTWQSSDPALTVNSPAASKTDTGTKVWLGGGTPETIPTVTNTVVTSNNGRTLQQSFQCSVGSYNLM